MNNDTLVQWSYHSTHFLLPSTHPSSIQPFIFANPSQDTLFALLFFSKLYLHKSFSQFIIYNYTHGSLLFPFILSEVYLYNNYSSLQLVETAFGVLLRICRVWTLMLTMLDGWMTEEQRRAIPKDGGRYFPFDSPFVVENHQRIVAVPVRLPTQCRSVFLPLGGIFIPGE